MALASCSSSSSSSGGGGNTKAPITIGTSLSLTGDFSVDGQAFQRGYNLWVQSVNKSGGLLGGRKVKLTILNDNSDPTTVQSNYTKLIASDHVNLDFHATFTATLLRKDFDLGLAAARQADVPLPVAALVHEIIQSLIGAGHADQDFAALLELAAASAGLDLVSENADISDGLDLADTNNVNAVR